MSSMYITEPATNAKVCLSTTVGDIDIELWGRECPLACRNFIQLCLEGYYDGVVFHRLVKDFIVQTGDPTGSGSGGESIYGAFFKSEFHQRLKFDRRGLVGMASEGKNMNGSQFFFTLGETKELNKKHTLFGKVVGDTVFNMLKLNECEVNDNERPVREHRILSAKVLLNPFKDMRIRENKKQAKEEESGRKALAEKESRKRTAAAASTKQRNLLSFGDEIEDDESGAGLVKEYKSKSAHDVLNDDLLSRECAVLPEELGVAAAKESVDNEKREGRLDRIREKLTAGGGGRKRGQKVRFDEDGEKRKQEPDDNLDDVVNEHEEAEKRARLEKISSEVKALQKEYIKDVRGPKAKKEQDEDGTSTSDAMKTYTKMKLKFKDTSKKLVKSADPKRETQTMALLSRFQTKLKRASVGGILADRPVDMSDRPTQEELIEMATAEDQGKIELDVEDLATDNWMYHTLKAPEGIRKDARDANMRNTDGGGDEWYPIDDPRHRLNVLKRESGATTAKGGN